MFSHLERELRRKLNSSTPVDNHQINFFFLLFVIRSVFSAYFHVLSSPSDLVSLQFAGHNKQF